LLVGSAELALAEARSGQLDEAEAQLAICRRTLDDGEDWAGIASLVNLAGAVILGMRGEFDASWEAFDRALRSARDYGLVWVEAKILREWARTHLARGQKNDRNDALRLLDEAAEIFRRLGAPKHVEVVLGDKLAAQGIESSNVQTSIDRVAASVQSHHPDLKSHAAPDGTVTIMFSDIEGSTVLTERLGDKAWMEVLREHNAIVRVQIKAHNGFEVKSEGDGFMVAFQSAGKALACASAIQKALVARNDSADEPVLVRVGLHAGEVIKEGEDFFGRNVIMAARVASQAHGGEILASGILKGLVEGSDVVWGEKRSVVLKGLSGEHEIWAVEWRTPDVPSDTGRAETKKS
jgi:class 3 adenylate cyclase